MFVIESEGHALRLHSQLVLERQHREGIKMSSTQQQQDLESWVKEKLESLYLNKVDGDFDSYFDSVFAPEVQLTGQRRARCRETSSSKI